MSFKKNPLERHWYQTSYTWLTLLLLPFSWLFRVIVVMRYFFYRMHFFKKTHFKTPIIVVGNLTVGGTGKTPFVIWLAEILQKQGYRPGIVSRGVGGKALLEPYWVDKNADPKTVGDEAILLTKRTQCPMVVCVDRVLAVKELLQKTHCNIVISDDGLQHYAMDRQIEIAIVDGAREWGNGQMLPAGPLRESLKRLHRVDIIVVNGECQFQHAIWKSAEIEKKLAYMHLDGNVLCSIQQPHKTCALEVFPHKTIHAVAGIGNPQRFFLKLHDVKRDVIEHIFPDHYLYQPNDIYFGDDLPVIMTEKDAVKCVGFADQRHWYLPVRAKISSGLEKRIFSLLR